jgi:hypothetical protein
MNNCTDYEDSCRVRYVHVKRLQSTGHRVWMFENRIPDKFWEEVSDEENLPESQE